MKRRNLHRLSRGKEEGDHVTTEARGDTRERTKDRKEYKHNVNTMQPNLMLMLPVLQTLLFSDADPTPPVIQAFLSFPSIQKGQYFPMEITRDRKRHTLPLVNCFDHYCTQHQHR